MVNLNWVLFEIKKGYIFFSSDVLEKKIKIVKMFVNLSEEFVKNDF